MTDRSIVVALFSAVQLIIPFAPIYGQTDPQQLLKPLPVDAVLGAMHINTDVALSASSDGRWIAFTTDDRRRAGRHRDDVAFTPTGVPLRKWSSDVWVIDRQGGQSRNLTAGRGASWGPVWSPDGRLLAFYSDRDDTAGAWIWERAGDTFYRAAPIMTRSRHKDEIRWTPDGSGIIVLAVPDGESATASPPVPEVSSDATAPSVQVFSAGLQDQETKERPSTADAGSLGGTDLVLIDVETGAVRRLAHHISTHWFEISPDGRYVAFTTRLTKQDPQTFGVWYDLRTVRLSDGVTATAASGVPMFLWGRPVSWSPDSKWLAYLTSAMKETLDGEVHLASADGATPATIVRAGRHAPFDNLGSAPLWEATGNTIYLLGGDTLWAVDRMQQRSRALYAAPGKQLAHVIEPSDAFTAQRPGVTTIVVATYDSATSKSGIVRIDVSNGAATVLVEEPRKYTYQAGRGGGLTLSDGAVVYVAEGADQPEDLWIVQRGQKPLKLTHLNPRLDSIVYGQARTVRWVDRRGNPARGALLLPAGYQPGRRYPLVVFLYAKSQGEENAFGFWGGFYNMQLLATRGYAVLYPDIPERRGDEMKQRADVVLPGVDRVVALGIADSARVGVMGHSYGGYGTLALLVQSTRFKAAMESAGAADWLSAYGAPLDADGSSSGVRYAEGQEGFRDHPWGARDQYIANSPWFFLDRVATPLLILQGTADEKWTLQSDAVFTALKRLGKPVQYAKYANEGHAQEWWGWPNKVDAAQRYLDWFDRHLRKRE